MARIRYVKTPHSKNNTAPKVVFFHNKNFDNYTNTRTRNLYGRGSTNLVAINEDQYKKGRERYANRHNGVVTFHNKKKSAKKIKFKL